jgi:hypothetical protein
VQRYEAKVSAGNMAGEDYDAGATSYYLETDALIAVVNATKATPIRSLPAAGYGIAEPASSLAERSAGDARDDLKGLACEVAETTSVVDLHHGRKMLSLPLAEHAEMPGRTHGSPCTHLGQVFGTPMPFVAVKIPPS